MASAVLAGGGVTDMTPSEIQAVLAEIAAEAGPKAHASIDVAVSDIRTHLVTACFWPEGVTGRGHSIHTGGSTFAEALKKLREEWDAAKALADNNTLRKMALAVIEISTDIGACTDASLRGRGFSQQQVTRLGKSACEEATRLAAGGPFSILATTGTNAIAAE
jgi:hypothetical protein